MNAAKYGPEFEDTFGNIKNMPIIPIENIRVPVYTWVGEDDELARPEASEIIREKVKTVQYYKVLPKFDHGHMNWLKEEDIDIYYNDIISKMRGKVYAKPLWITLQEYNQVQNGTVDNGGNGGSSSEGDLGILYNVFRNEESQHSILGDPVMVKPKEVKTFWEATKRDMWVLTSGIPGFSFFFRDIPFHLNLWQGVGDLFGTLEKHYYAGLVGAYYRNEMEYYQHVVSQNQIFDGMFDEFEPN